MAESDLSRTSYRGVERAEVRIAPTDPQDALRTVRDDGHAYEPLVGPGYFPPGYAPPEPPQPDEDQLRHQLSAELEAQHIADTRFTDAGNAHARARRHVERCQCDLQRYANIDADLVTATVDALRGEAGQFDVPDDVRQQLAERDVAAAGLAAAQRACTMLEQDLAAARIAATEAKRRADTLICGVLNFEAARIAERHAALLAQAAALAEQLHSFNQFGAGRSVSMPQSVRMCLGHDISALARRRDQAPWRAAAERLRENPQAVVDI